MATFVEENLGWTVGDKVKRHDDTKHYLEKCSLGEPVKLSKSNYKYRYIERERERGINIFCLRTFGLTLLKHVGCIPLFEGHIRPRNLILVPKTRVWKLFPVNYGKNWVSTVKFQGQYIHDVGTCKNQQPADCRRYIHCWDWWLSWPMHCQASTISSTKW